MASPKKRRAKSHGGRQIDSLPPLELHRGHNLSYQQFNICPTPAQHILCGDCWHIPTYRGAKAQFVTRDRHNLTFRAVRAADISRPAETKRDAVVRKP